MIHLNEVLSLEFTVGALKLNFNSHKTEDNWPSGTREFKRTSLSALFPILGLEILIDIKIVVSALPAQIEDILQI